MSPKEKTLSDLLIKTDKKPQFSRFLRPDFRFDAGSHAYFFGDLEIPGPSALFKEFGLVDDRFFKDFHAQKGKSVHLTCQIDDAGDLEESTLDPRLLPYLQAYRRCKNELGFIPIPDLSERPIASELYRFGTTPDIIGRIGKDFAILELKSGKSFPWTTAIQTAFQQIAFLETYKESIFLRFGAHLKEDGGYNLHQFSNPEDREKAILLVKIHWLKREKKNDARN